RNGWRRLAGDGGQARAHSLEQTQRAGRLGKPPVELGRGTSGAVVERAHRRHRVVERAHASVYHLAAATSRPMVSAVTPDAPSTSPVKPPRRRWASSATPPAAP